MVQCCTDDERMINKIKTSVSHINKLSYGLNGGKSFQDEDLTQFVNMSKLSMNNKY